VNDSPEQFPSFRLSMPGLAQSGGRLEPAENLFHPFAFDLTDGVSGMASGATVDGAVNRILIPLVVTLVGTQRDPTLVFDLYRHRLPVSSRHGCHCEGRW
jgi:hypothetical protein